MKPGMGCFAAFIGLFYTIGFGLLGCGVWSALRSTQAARWPTTPGTLTQIDLQEKSDSDGSTYEVKVEYTYTVAGHPYNGSRLAYGYTASGGRDAHEEIYAALKAAKSVDVRYDPENPASSALSFGMHRSILFVLAFAFT